MSRFTGLLLCVALALCACAVPRDNAPSSVEDGTVTVRTTAGLLRGKVEAGGAVEVFKGVPFAAPPVGELRWKAPRPPVPWGGERDASSQAALARSRDALRAPTRTACTSTSGRRTAARSRSCR